jgi:hypothetical protein
MRKSISEPNGSGAFLQTMSQKTLLFQLNESNNIEKVMSILLLMSTKDSELLKIANASELSRILVSIVSKYVDGYYGYDTKETPLISHAIFHHVLLGLFCKLGDIQRVELTRCLNSERFLVKLGLIIEDGASHIVENYFNLTVHSENDYSKFYEASAKVLELAFELGSNKKAREALEVMSDLLKRIGENCGSQKVSEIEFLPTKFKIFVKNLKDFHRKSEIQYEVMKNKDIKETKSVTNVFSKNLVEHDRLKEKSQVGRVSDLYSDRSFGNYSTAQPREAPVLRGGAYRSTVSLH